MKRSIDIFLSLFAMASLSPLLVALAIAVKLDSEGPAIYWSTRIGKNGKPFQMPKFRSMLVRAPEVPTHELEDPHAHITRLGRFLRKYSLDEIPQLYSVLIGHMSLVGPRPLMPELQGILKQRAINGIHQLRPGITGWAQINGRDLLDDEQKLAFDLEYLQRCSIAFDFWIMFGTVGYILKSRDVVH